MTRILLCDDEGIVLESLTYTIRKSFGEECPIETAKNGRTAIELMESFHPDIVFMDIQMPGINGIEAMQEIRKEHKNVIFIVLTAYDKFEYSKCAIEVGVMAYLTKPFNRNTVVDILQKAIKAVQERKNKASRELEIKEKLEVVVPLIESGFVYSVLLEDPADSDLLRYRELLALQGEYGYAMVIECGEEFRKGVLSNTLGAGIYLQKHYMVFREMVKEATSGIVGALMANKVIVFIPCPKWYPALPVQVEYEERLAEIERARALLRKLEQQIALHFKAGIGSVKRWENMAESYKEALETVRVGIGKVVHMKDLSVGCVYEETYPYELEQKLFQAVSKGGQNETKALSREFMEWMTEHTKGLTDGAKLKAMEFVLYAERTAYQQGGMIYRFEDRNGYLEMVNSMQSAEELALWFVKKMEDACGHVARKQQEKSDSIIGKAKDYIASHFTTELSLEELAKELNISPYYLSKLFKESEGINYISYVTSLRMEHAKSMLRNTDTSIKEICVECGYSDPNYFSRIFKKWTGVTSTEYREGGGRNA